jgi:hypothetical protein
MLTGNCNRAARWLLTLGAAAIAVGIARPAAASCGKAPATWPSSPRVLLHVSELKGPTGFAGVGNEMQLLSQVTAAVDQFNAIGATSARVATVETTIDPFVYNGSYDDLVPTIHVGFRPANQVVNAKGEKVGGRTTMPIYLSNNCSPTVTIEFPDLDGMAWSFSSPFALAADGARYYDAGRTAPTVDGGGEWFRTSFLHELMHGFGLGHTSSQYAMMNHRGSGDPNGGFPWANRPDADAVRPLPYDVKLLRASYPASGSRWEVAVLNTWFHVTTDSEGAAADQVKLCTPSLGDRLKKDETTSGVCGAGGANAGSTRVSEGLMLQTRFALANYSTGSVHVTSRLWLSTDEELGYGDSPALSWDIRDIAAETSDLAEVAFKLPWLPDGTYHAIVVISSEHVNADGSIDPYSPTSDWMPLRGTITVCSGLCPMSPGSIDATVDPGMSL